MRYGILNKNSIKLFTKKINDCSKFESSSNNISGIYKHFLIFLFSNTCERKAIL